MGTAYEIPALQGLGDVKASTVSAVPFSMDADLACEIASIGRTEDVVFSPDGGRLAIIGHLANRLLLLSIDRRSTGDEPPLHLHSPLLLESSALAYPHGAFWIDEQTLVVANRGGAACIFRVPPPGTAGLHRVEPLHGIGTLARDVVHSPGSVSARALADGWVEVLLCNNYAHQVSQHLLRVGERIESIVDSVLLQKGLEIPDGVAQSFDGQWIAISNHNEHAVRIYRNGRTLGPDSEPQATLTGVSYPHGLRFTRCGRYLLVADAGLPFVYLYHSADGQWQGRLAPRASLSVIDAEEYVRGHHGPEEGGPKGIDLDAGGMLMVVSNHEQPLAFFDMRTLLPKATEALDKAPLLDDLARHFLGQGRANQQAWNAAAALGNELESACRQVQLADERASRYEAELELMRSQARQAALHTEQLQTELDYRRSQEWHASHRADYLASELAACHASSSWRLTAPWRAFGHSLRRLLGR